MCIIYSPVLKYSYNMSINAAQVEKCEENKETICRLSNNNEFILIIKCNQKSTCLAHFTPMEISLSALKTRTHTDRHY